MTPSLLAAMNGFWILTTADHSVEWTGLVLSRMGESHYVEDISILENGDWLVSPSQMEVRWATSDHAQLRFPGEPWTKALLLMRGSLPQVRPPEFRLHPTYREAVVPGLWATGFVECDLKRPAWYFSPLLREPPAFMVTRTPNGWKIEPFGGAGECIGNGLTYVSSGEPKPTNLRY